MHTAKLTWRLAVGLVGLLLTFSPASAQTVPTQTTTPAVKTKLTPAERQAAAKQAAADRKAAAQQAAEQRAAAKQGATQSAATAQPVAAVKPAATTSTATALPSRASTAATNAAATTSAAAGGLPSRVAGTSSTSPPASSTSTAPAPSSGTSRSALTTQGLGSFQAGDYSITAYGCYRSGNSVLCDFDLSKGRAAQLGLEPFNNIVLVDNGGKINHRHSAYYMGTDGTHMTNAYVSSTPVRYVMEFDDIGAQVSSASLVRAANRIDNVPIKAAGSQ